MSMRLALILALLLGLLMGCSPVARWTVECHAGPAVLKLHTNDAELAGAALAMCVGDEGVEEPTGRIVRWS
jgi:hypothetical protein